MTKALVTGIAGFAGSHLAEHLLKNNISVFGFYHPSHPTQNIEKIKSRLTLVDCNILDSKKVLTEITRIRPDMVFHLAAFSSPSKSFINPRETLENNVSGQINILDALEKIQSKARILIIGSSDEYGNVDKKNLPANEQTPFAPISPYAVSKVTQDILALQYFLHNNLDIVRVRPFPHIGPRQSIDFVVPAFASQIAKIEKSGKGTMSVGNLETFRDFTDVRDVVASYLLALKRGKSGDVYNIGSGELVKIKKILDMLLSMSKAEIKVKRSAKSSHKSDVQSIYCDNTKFKDATGWEPKIPLSKTLSDTINYERERVKPLSH